MKRLTIKALNRLGHWLMGLPTGIYESSDWVLMYGWYRWGAILASIECESTQKSNRHD